MNSVGSVDAAIAAKLKAGREQREVVGPLVQFLIDRGWHLGQIHFGKKEWRVPKSPSEATKREKRESFDGFPCDVAIFDDPKRLGDPRHLVAILEAKTPNEDAGVSQLESYMTAEPYARVGIWTNTADSSAPAVFVYRDRKGKLVRRRRPLADMPRPGEEISPKHKQLTFKDLVAPSSESLRRNIQHLLDRVVVEDSKVTRREEQLDQLCNVLLLKLHSDKRAKVDPSSPPSFRLMESASRTADETRKSFRKLVEVYPDTFATQQDRELRLADQTIHACVEWLAPYRLLDMGVETVSLGFQILRSQALRAGEGQYFTPQPVIEAGVKLLQLELDDIIIDPACGTGGFLVEVLVEMQRRSPGSDFSRWAQTNIFGIDKDPVGIKLTKAIMLIAGDGSAHCVRGDSLRTHLWAKEHPGLHTPSFKDGRFSVIVTNPPFGRTLKVSSTDAHLSGLDIAAGSDGNYRDLEIGLLMLQRAHQLLAKGGRVGIVLPETYFFSPQYKFVLEWIKPRLRPVAVANIPMEAFQGFCRAKTNFYVFKKVG